MAGADLRHFDLRHQALYGTDLRGSRLRGAHITLECHTFDGVILDDVQVALVLLLLAKARIDSAWTDRLKATVNDVLGEEAARKLHQYVNLT